MSALTEAVQALILAAAVSHNVDPDLMDHIAACESGYNARAVAGPYVGLYQLGTSKRKQFTTDGYTDVFDPAQQANFVAELIANGETSDWVNCAK